MELGSNAAIKHAVIAGLGVAVLPKLSLLAELRLKNLHAISLNGFPLNRSWSVFTRIKISDPSHESLYGLYAHQT